MLLKRPGLILALLLSALPVPACTHTEQASEETMEPSAGEAALAPEPGTSDQTPGDPAPEDSASSDFTDPSEVGLSEPTQQAEAAREDPALADSVPMPSDATSALDAPDFLKEGVTSSAELEKIQVSVYFAKNSSRVKKQYRLSLKEVAQRLKADSELRVQVAGHTDARGSSKFNKRLALKRAQAVRTALVRLGVKSKQVHLESFGKDKLLAQGQSEQEHAQNRRVEVAIE